METYTAPAPDAPRSAFGHRAIAAEHAAVAWLWFEPCAAACADVKEEAGVALPAHAGHAGLLQNMNHQTPEGGEITFFQVRLRCEAAPEIGCGLRAKPVLQDLERVPGIGEAWLSRTGNLIAVVRTLTGRETEGADPVLAVFRKHRVAIEALRGARFAQALNEFASRSGWHRGAGVDQLSAEEAHTIAARLVARLRSRAALPEPGFIDLEKALAEAGAHELIRNPTQSAAARKRRLASAFLAAASGRLDALAYTAFADAVRLGHRPLPDER